MSSEVLSTLAIVGVTTAIVSIQFWMRGQRGASQGGKPRPLLMWDIRFVAPLIFIALILQMSGRLMRENWFGLSAWANIALILAVGALGVALFAAWLRGRSRLKKAAEEMDYRLCTHCGYSLKGLPVKHTCPECGQPYDMSAVRTKWHRALGD